MKTFVRTLIGFFTVITIIYLLILTTLVFFLLNPRFYQNSFSKPGVYKNLEKGLKAYARNSLRMELAQQNKSYNNLTVGQRKEIDTQIEKLLTPISEENIRDFSDKNIQNILIYANGKTPELTIYLPIMKWGLPKESIERLPDYLTTENINVTQVLEEHPEINVNRDRLTSLSLLGQRARKNLLFSLILTLILVKLHSLASSKSDRVSGPAKLITVAGILILFLSWIMKIAAGIFGQNIAARVNAGDIIAGTLGSALLTDIFKFWLIVGIVLLIAGLVLFNVKTTPYSALPQSIKKTKIQ